MGSGQPTPASPHPLRVPSLSSVTDLALLPLGLLWLAGALALLVAHRSPAAARLL
jgi:hypothetical protein